MASIEVVRETISQESFLRPIAQLLGNDRKKLTSFKSSLLEISQNPLIAKCDLKSVLLSAKHIAEMKGKLITALGVAFISATLMTSECRANEEGRVALENKASKLYDNMYCHTLQVQVAEIVREDARLKNLAERIDSFKPVYMADTN